MRKWKENDISSFSLHFLSISSFSHHFLFISSFSLHFLTLSPFPLNFLIFPPFPHSLSISSQPGTKAPAGCATLVPCANIKSGEISCSGRTKVCIIITYFCRTVACMEQRGMPQHFMVCMIVPKVYFGQNWQHYTINNGPLQHLGMAWCMVCMVWYSMVCIVTPLWSLHYSTCMEWYGSRAWCAGAHK